MRHALLRGLAVMAVLLAPAAPAGAQSLDPGPPGPYVIDVRGVLTQVPSAFILLLEPPEDALAPTGGLGLAVGAHVYPFAIGPARVGLGASVLHARATAVPEGAAVPEIGVRMTSIAPELSLNFGTGDGWSYLSAGAGWAGFSATLGDVAAQLEAESGRGAMLHYGGGARWFLNRHLAIGFDVRAHQLQGRPIFDGITQLPRTTKVAASVGVSLR